MNHRLTEFEIEIENYKMKSDQKIQGWLKQAFSKKYTKVLDAGCGLGGGFCNILCLLPTPYRTTTISYNGIDLIPLSNTKRFLEEHLPSFFDDKNCIDIDLNMKEVSMLTPPNNLIGSCDLVMAIGTLHHTPGVKESLIATLKCVRSGGYYLGWIINEQKPLRAITDQFFRDYFSQFTNLSECEEELHALVEIFQALSESVGDKTIIIKNNLEFMGLSPGEYGLQSLLYDYIVKCYHRSGVDPRWNIYSLFDWFNPEFYHQTSREQLDKLIQSIDCVEPIDIVTKASGHFFFLKVT